MADSLDTPSLPKIREDHEHRLMQLVLAMERDGYSVLTDYWGKGICYRFPDGVESTQSHALDEFRSAIKEDPDLKSSVVRFLVKHRPENVGQGYGASDAEPEHKGSPFFHLESHVLNLSNLQRLVEIALDVVLEEKHPVPSPEGYTSLRISDENADALIYAVNAVVSTTAQVKHGYYEAWEEWKTLRAAAKG